MGKPCASKSSVLHCSTDVLEIQDDVLGVSGLGLVAGVAKAVGVVDIAQNRAIAPTAATLCVREVMLFLGGSVSCVEDVGTHRSCWP